MGLVLTVQPSIFGTGLAFPLQLDTTQSRILVLSESDVVKSDLLFMLQTNTNERPFLQKVGPLGPAGYGTQLMNSLFMDVETASNQILFETKLAIVTWEPRVTYKNTVIQQTINSQGLVVLNAKTYYQLRSTNRPDNFVIPYLLQAPVSE